MAMFNSEDNILITGTAEADSIINSASNVTIDGGNGNDYIYHWWRDNVSINGGEGDDSIHNNQGSNITINGGKGNDYISSVNQHDSNKNVLFKYSKGDGNDTIEGFNDTSTLSIGGGTYSTQISGANVIVTVGEGKITLEGVMMREDSIHINDETIELDKNIKLTDDNDDVGNYRDNVTIDGGNGNDDIYNGGDYVTIDGDAGDDDISNSYSNNVSINGGAGNDSIENYAGDNVTIAGGAGDDSIHNSRGDNVLFKYSEGDGNDTITGFRDTSTLSVGGGTYSTQTKGNDVIVTIGEGKITLKNITSCLDSIHINNKTIELDKNIKLTDGNDDVDNYRDNVSIDGGEGDDFIGNLYGSNVSITSGDDNDTICNWGDNVTIDGGEGNDSIYNYYGDNVLFKYSEGDGNDTIKGFDSTSTLSIGDGTGTYSTTKSGSDIIVMVGNDKIILTGAASLATINIDGVLEGKWTYQNSKATYKVEGKTLVTVSGVKSKTGLSIDDKIVTVSNAALNKTKVTVSAGYTLELGDDVTDKAELGAVDWSVKKGKATFTQTASAGYSCDGKTINYSKKKTTLTVATITNLNSKATKNDIELDDDTITLTENALTTDTKKPITLKGNGYKLAIDDELTSAEQDEFWTISGTTATYGIGTPAHYDCTDTKITYTAATLDTTKLKLTGLKKNLTAKDMDEIQIDDDGTVTLDKSLLNKKTVTLAGTGYKLSDEGLAPETSTKWNGSKLLRTSTDGYKLNGTGTALTYTKAAKNQTIATVSGTKKNLTANNYDEDTNTVKLANADLKAKVTVSGSVAFEFAEDYSGSITGSKAANTIAVAGVNVSVNAGKGNDIIDLGDGSATFFYASGDGNDVIANFTAGTDKIVVTKGKVKTAASGSDVIVTVDKGKITLTGAANQTFDIVDKKDKVLATYTTTRNNLLYSDNYGTQPQIDSLLAESSDYSVGEIETSNGMNLTQDKTQLTFGKK